MTMWMLSLIHAFYRLQRQARDQLRARARFALDLEEAAQALHPLTHPNQSQVLITAGQQRPIKARSLIRDLDDQITRFRARTHLLADSAGMAIGIVQRLLDDPVQGDLDRQGSLFRQATEVQCYPRPSPPLVGAHDPSYGLGKRQIAQLWKSQPTRDRPHLLQGVVEGTIDHLQIFAVLLAVRTAGAIPLTAGYNVIQPQKRQTDILGRAVVQLGADPAQKSFIERSGAGSGAPHPLVQLRVLLQQI